jgi:predicted  nucleic acid-binding Zn-ribbon protein
VADFKSPIIAYECKHCGELIAPDAWNIVGYCPNCTCNFYLYVTEADRMVIQLEGEVAKLRLEVEALRKAM